MPPNLKSVVLERQYLGKYYDLLAAGGKDKLPGFEMYLVEDSEPNTDDLKHTLKERWLIAPGVKNKIEKVTADMEGYARNALYRLSLENAETLCDYVAYERGVQNIAPATAQTHISKLSFLAMTCDNKNFKEMTNDDIRSHLETGKKPEKDDPTHKWIGSYISKRKIFAKFFGWIYYPDAKPRERPTPPPLKGIPYLKRKETSNYSSKDMWREEEFDVFYRHCPDKRLKCYVAMAHDTSCRPHELLKLKIKDVVFQRSANGKIFSIVQVNSGKTGQRALPLIDSIAYIKEWLREHPSQGNGDAYLFVTKAPRSFGGRLRTSALRQVLQKIYKAHYFPRLLEKPNVPDADKARIRMLLTHPWNPYIQRHTGLTKKAREKISRFSYCQYAGWSPNSKMPERYIHQFGDESAIDILKEHGIIPKTEEKNNENMVTKPCPHCRTSNTSSARFCYSCDFAMSIEGHEQARNHDGAIKEQFEQLRREIEAVRSSIKDDDDNKKTLGKKTDAKSKHNSEDKNQ